MTYTFQQTHSGARTPFSEHQYRIYKGGRLVATYWHDHRGDDHEIDFADGRKDEWLVGRMTDFLEGGGPQPLVLYERAVAYLEAKQQ